MGNSINTKEDQTPASNNKFPPDYDPHKYKFTRELSLHPIFYNNGGLYYNIEEYEKVFPDIIWWSIAEQIKYSDAITRRYCLNPLFLQNQNAFFDDDMNKYLNANAVSIGNLACAAYYNGVGSKYYDHYNRVLAFLKTQYNRLF